MLSRYSVVIEDLTVEFKTKNGVVRAVDKANLRVREGEVLGILGESGSGKSVLGQTILSLLPENAVARGRVVVCGVNVLGADRRVLRRLRGEVVAWVPQNTGLTLNPMLKLGVQLIESPVEHGVPSSEAWGFVKRVLKKLSLDHEVARRYQHQLSGGMKQRVLFAIGLSCKPKVIVVDEPTKGLDKPKRRMVAQLIESVRMINPKATIIVISHDIDFIESVTDRVAVMYCGWIIEVSRTGSFFKKPLHPYSRMLLETTPSRSFKPIPGDPPSMINPPPGCRFHPRCPFATSVCRVREPPEIKVGDGVVKCWLYK